MFRPFLYDHPNMVVHQGVENHFPIPALPHQLIGFQKAQLMGHRRLCQAQPVRQVADTGIPLHQQEQDMDTGGVPQQLEKFRQDI